MGVVDLGYAKRALAVLVFTVLLGCEATSEEQAAAPPPQVDVARVQAEEVTLWGSFTGRIAAPETVELRPRVNGYIDRIAFAEGDLVKEGELLFVIDQRPYRARLRVAQAQLARAQSEFELASSEAARAEKLWQRKAIAREEFEQRNAALLAARAATDTAAAELESAQLELEYTSITAPITGRIGRAEVTRGNLATADATLLATLVSVDPVHVYFESDQSSAELAGSIMETHLPVRVSVENQPGHYLEGQLDFVNNRYDSRTGTLQYRALLPNPDYRLRPGQFARVEMPLARADEAILVDQKAVLADQDRRYVYVLAEDNTVARRYVEVGRRFQGLQLINDGLRHGERVVVNGLQKIAVPGIQVAPQLVDMRRDAELPALADSSTP